MIPENKQELVRKALQNAFQVDSFEKIEQLTKGLSSAVIYKISVSGNPYLLRIIMRDDAIADPTYYFERMQLAAENGIGPRVYYASNRDRISITDFINEQSFSREQARETMPRLLRQLHLLPKFPFKLDYFERMDNFIEKFKTANTLPENETRDLFETYARIRNVYPTNDQDDLVSCHNDVKAENIIFDGNRPWLVDWEAAFLNDRYLDLSMIANFILRTDDEDINFLETYLGQSINEFRMAKFFLMRQMLHLFYFTFLMLIDPGKKPIDLQSIKKIDFNEFHDGMWSGKINLAGNTERLQYARVHFERFRETLQTKRFEDSLSKIGSRQKAQGTRH